MKENKQLKKEQKRLQKEAKAKAKVDKLQQKTKTPKKTTKFNHDQQENISLTKKQAKRNLFEKKDLKKSKDKEPKDYKTGFKEFPIKMVKEVSKVKWSSKQNLIIKFIQVIIFMVVAAALFYLVDLAFQELFMLMKVI